MRKAKCLLALAVVLLHGSLYGSVDEPSAFQEWKPTREWWLSELNNLVRLGEYDKRWDYAVIEARVEDFDSGALRCLDTMVVSSVDLSVEKIHAGSLPESPKFYSMARVTEVTYPGETGLVYNFHSGHFSQLWLEKGDRILAIVLKLVEPRYEEPDGRAERFEVRWVAQITDAGISVVFRILLPPLQTVPEFRDVQLNRESATIAEKLEDVLSGVIVGSGEPPVIGY